MANTKISGLSSASTPLTGSEIVPLNQSGVSDSVSVANLTAGRAVSAASLTLSTGNVTQGASGTGYNFTANTPASGMTSQNLTWYEEGTWTPTLASSGGGTPTYVRQIGRYTRIGNRVLFQIEIDLASKGTLAAGNLSLTGLPFTSNSTVANWAGVTVGLCDGFTYPVLAMQLTAIVDYNNTTVGLYWIKSGAATNNVVLADISTTPRINFSGQYMI